MGCCGDREKGMVSEEQKWDYITLSDFKSKSCIAPFSYMWLWMLAIIAVAVYVADTFTAVNLIAFDRWSSQVRPTIPFEISKWIFFVCICLSWALAALEWLRAIRVMRGGGVADSYLDPLAATLQSIRVGRGQGWRRFLVFTELTKSKKGTDYIALFVYFQFKGAIRIVLAEGPRQVVNALTLWSVMRLDLVPQGDHAATKGHSPLQQFFINVEALADTNHEQAVILSAMLFTLVIWVIAALSLLLALVLYLMFLWHYIPSADGTLSSYCRRKVDRRLEVIVSAKVQKALQKQDAKWRKEERKAAKLGEKAPGLVSQPTLPSIAGSDVDSKSDLGLSRQDSFATLPPYTSQPPTRTNTMNSVPTMNTMNRQPSLPEVGQQVRRPYPLARTGTQSSAYSNASYSSNAPLLSDASPIGYSDPGRRSPVPALPPLNTDDYQGMNNLMTPQSASSSSLSPRPFSPMGRPGPAQGRSSPMGMRPDGYRSPGPQGPGLSRQGTDYFGDGRNSPGPMGQRGPAPVRQNTYNSTASRRTPGPSPLASDPSLSPYDRRSPAPGPAYEMNRMDQTSPRPPPSFVNNGYTNSPISNDDYDPYRPSSGASGRQTPQAPAPPQPRPLPSAVLQSAIQRREASNPLPLRVGAASVPPQQVQRSVTSPMGGPMYPQSRSPVHRAATAGPGPSPRGPPDSQWN